MLNNQTKTIKSILARHHASPQQSLGQNFLVNTSVIDDLVNATHVTSDDFILEIGTGLGSVTIPLAKRARHVFSVEISPTLTEAVRREYPQYLSKLTLVTEDALRLDVQNLLDGHEFTPPQYKVVGSIPYQITSPLIHKFLTVYPPPTSIIFLIQKEVAEKITAKPPQASYLSNFVASRGTATIVKGAISPGAFYPPPRVESAIISIDLEPTYPDLDPTAFSDFLHQGFEFPRKMLRNVFSEELLTSVGVNPQQRPQELELQQWVALFNKIEARNL